MWKYNAVKLNPTFKEYIWGGNKLKKEYNKQTDSEALAESWELSAHKDGESSISGGEYDGFKFSEYIDKVGREVLGTKAATYSYFPILIKLIDAKDNLSVQVHPNDEYALKNEGEYGKTEMWYILDCESGASLYYGFARDITKQEYEQAIKNNTLTNILNKVEVQRGDVFFIPAGMVHAIGAGIVICEIQQNSNTTYRVYDYNRKGKDGKPRDLHIEKALDVSVLKKSPPPVKPPAGDNVELAKCDYFTVRRLRVYDEGNINIDETSFHSLIVVEGDGIITVNDSSMKIQKGDSIFIPAQCGVYNIKGRCELILSKI